MPTTSPLRAVHPIEQLLSKVIVIGENNKRGIDQVDDGLARLEKKLDGLILSLEISDKKRDVTITRIFIALLVIGLLGLAGIFMSAFVLLHETQSKPMIIVPVSQDRFSELQK